MGSLLEEFDEQKTLTQLVFLKSLIVTIAIVGLLISVRWIAKQNKLS